MKVRFYLIAEDAEGEFHYDVKHLGKEDIEKLMESELDDFISGRADYGWEVIEEGDE
jgi:hypothetical protein